MRLLAILNTCLKSKETFENCVFIFIDHHTYLLHKTSQNNKTRLQALLDSVLTLFTICGPQNREKSQVMSNNIRIMQFKVLRAKLIFIAYNFYGQYVADAVFFCFLFQFYLISMVRNCVKILQFIKLHKNGLLV